MKVDRGWSSHNFPLIKYVLKTSGPILELGTGLFSTPILHWLALENNRELISYENYEKYYKLVRSFNKGNHKVIFVDDYDKAEIERPWDVVLIDNGPEARRIVDIKRVANYAKYIIVHDTEPEVEALYGYKKAFSDFKYQLQYTKSKPYTTILSNLEEL